MAFEDMPLIFQLILSDLVWICCVKFSSWTVLVAFWVSLQWMQGPKRPPVQLEASESRVSWNRIPNVTSAGTGNLKGL